MPARRSRVRITEINPQLTCVLCGGYYIDATTIIECLHSFCKTCIVRYLESSKYCPICDVQVHKTRPLLNIRPDQTLQDLVYKLVPGLFTSEMYKRRQYYKSNPPSDGTSDNEIDQYERQIHSTDDKISIMLEFSPNGKPVITPPSSTKRPTKRSSSRLRPYIDGLDHIKTPDRRYLECPAEFTVGHLKKFVRMKFGLSEKYEVDIFYVGAPLMEKYALMDIAYIYYWKGNGPLRLFYTIFENPVFSAKRRKLTELPMNNMPLPTSLPVSLPLPVSIASSPSSEAPIVISSASPSPVASKSISRTNAIAVPSTSCESKHLVPVTLPARVVPKGNRGPPAPPKPKTIPTQHVSPTTWSVTPPSVSQVTLLGTTQKPSMSTGAVPETSSKKQRDPNKPRKKSKKEGKKRKEKNRSGKEGKRKDHLKHKSSKSKNGSREKEQLKSDLNKTESPTLVRLPISLGTTTTKETVVVKPVTQVVTSSATVSEKDVSGKPSTTSAAAVTNSPSIKQQVSQLAAKKSAVETSVPAGGKEMTSIRSTPPTIKKDGMPQSTPSLATTKQSLPTRTLGDFSKNVPPVIRTIEPSSSQKDTSSTKPVTKIATFTPRNDLTKSRLIAGPKTFVTGGTTVPLISPIRPIPSQPLTNQRDKAVCQLKDSSKDEVRRPVTLPQKPGLSAPVTTHVRKVPAPPVIQSFSKPQFTKAMALPVSPPQTQAQTQRKISDYIQTTNGPTPNPKPIVSHAMPQTVKMPIPGGNGVSPTRKVQALPLARANEIAIGLKPVNGPLSKPTPRSPVTSVRSPLISSHVTTKSPVLVKSPVTTKAPIVAKNPVNVKPPVTTTSPVSNKPPLVTKGSQLLKGPVTSEVRTLSNSSTTGDNKVRQKTDKLKGDGQVSAVGTNPAVTSSAALTYTSPTTSSKYSQPVKNVAHTATNNTGKNVQSKTGVQPKTSLQSKAVTSQSKVSSQPVNSDKTATGTIQKPKSDTPIQPEVKPGAATKTPSSTTAAATSTGTATTTTSTSSSGNSEQERPLDLHRPKSVSVS